MQVETSIRVRILDREYPLRVGEEDATTTVEMAAYLDQRIRAFRNTHPDQPELTSTVMAALAIADELFAIRDRYERDAEQLEDEAREMLMVLDSVLDQQ